MHKGVATERKEEKTNIICKNGGKGIEPHVPKTYVRAITQLLTA
jgi:hypothetical protein